MKWFGKRALIWASFVVLSSCQNAQTKPGIFQSAFLQATFNNRESLTFEQTVIAFNASMLNQLIDLEIPFLMYIGDPACGGCQAFQPILKAWILETNASVFYFNTLLQIHNFAELRNDYSWLFSEGFSTPTLYLVQGESRLLYARNQAAFSTLPRFRSWASNYFMVKPFTFFSQDIILNPVEKTLILLYDPLQPLSYYGTWAKDLYDWTGHFWIISTDFQQLIAHLNLVFTVMIQSKASLLWWHQGQLITYPLDEEKFSSDVQVWIQENVL